VTALVTSALAHQRLSAELSNWDGVWYLQMARHGFPHAVSAHQSTLGFLPAYGGVIWLLDHALSCSPLLAALLVSGAGGLVATLLVQRLATGWWGARAGLRAALLFSVFPGSVVFSMVYAEGLLIPLAAGCLLCLERRRFALAGALAAAAVAVEADGLVLVAVCAVACLDTLRRDGWRSREGRRSLAAPLLALIGPLATGGFLWWWAGTPFATFEVQRLAWHQSTTLLARPDEVRELVRQIGRGFRAAHGWRQLNQVSDLLGTLYLFVAGAALLARRVRPPIPAVAFCAAMAVITLTSHGTAPNPRMLLTAFPLVVVWARRLRGRGVAVVAGAFSVLLVLMSAMTFVPVSLRP